MPSEKSVSVIVGGYNEAPILENSLNILYSTFDGAFREWELILVDDASTDETRLIMERFAAQHEHVKVLRNYINLNFGTAVLRGMYAAQYEYVTFNACDLPISPQDLAAAVTMLDSTVDAVVFERQGYKTTRWRRITSDVNMLLLKLLYPKLTKGTPVLNYVKIYKRSILDKICPLARSPIFVGPEMVFRAKLEGLKVVNILAQCQVKNLRKGAFGHPHDILWGIYEMLRFRIRLWRKKI